MHHGIFLHLIGPCACTTTVWAPSPSSAPSDPLGAAQIPHIQKLGLSEAVLRALAA